MGVVLMDLFIPEGPGQALGQCSEPPSAGVPRTLVLWVWFVSPDPKSCPSSAQPDFLAVLRVQ